VTSLSPLRRGFAPGFLNYKKRCTRLSAASEKVYQLLSHGWWFSPGTPASSTTKTGRHDIAEILLKVSLNTINQILYTKRRNSCLFYVLPCTYSPFTRGGSRGGGRTRRAPPLKLENIWFFGVKSWFFTRNTTKFFAPPSARRNFFKCAPLTWNPGFTPDYHMTLFSSCFAFFYVKSNKFYLKSKLLYHIT
jgi:hypothetical protein